MSDPFQVKQAAEFICGLMSSHLEKAKGPALLLTKVDVNAAFNRKTVKKSVQGQVAAACRKRGVQLMFAGTHDAVALRTDEMRGLPRPGARAMKKAMKAAEAWQG